MLEVFFRGLSTNNQASKDIIINPTIKDKKDDVESIWKDPCTETSKFKKSKTVAAAGGC